jgi:hypothetical protein
VDQKHNQFLENRTAGKKERLKELCSLVGYKYEKFHNRLDGWLSSFSTFFSGISALNCAVKIIIHILGRLLGRSEAAIKKMERFN